MTIPFVRKTHFTYAGAVGLIIAVTGLFILAGWFLRVPWVVSALLATISVTAAGFTLLIIRIRRELSTRTKVEFALDEAEARYRQLFNSIDEGFCVIEMIFDDQQRPVDYRFLQVNPSFEHQTGMPGAVGKTMREIAPDHEAHWFETYGRIALTGKPERFQHAAEQLQRHFDVYALRFGDPEKRQVAIVFNDITERTQALEAVRRSEESLSVTLHSIGDAVMATDVEGRITRFNSIAEKLTGWTQAQALGRPVAEVFKIINEETREPAHIPVMDVLATGEIYGLANHTVLIARDGTEWPIADSAAPIRDQDGGILGAVLVFRDVTEEKKAERAIRENERQLRKLNDELERRVEERTSQMRQALITLDSTEDGAFIFDPDSLRHQYVNEGAAQQSGRTREELLGMSALDLIPDHDEREFRAMLAPLTRGENVSHRFTTAHYRKDGREFPVEINLQYVAPEGEKPRFIAIVRDITERVRAEKAIVEHEAFLRTVLTNLTDSIVACDADLNLTLFNRTTLEGQEQPFDGLRPEDWAKRFELFQPDGQTLMKLEEIPLYRAFTEGHIQDVEMTTKNAQGELRRLIVSGQAIHGKNNEKRGAVVVMHDITERQQLEEQLSQSQKMEAVGVLAGGIAHDFNNLLTAINGYSDLALRRMSETDPLRRHIEEVRQAGERAASLTGQLLAFSRKQVLQPRVHNINSTITEIEKLLRRIIRENIELRTVLDPNLGNINADPGRIEQVIMNLAVNARDAMPAGGTLTIETKNEYLDEAYASSHIEITPGPFVRMTVTDTGLGMDESTRKQIFEPFFTTKDVGKGTGLGLSTVFGIVKQSGGDIMVYSEIGHGTTFKIYLPCVDAAVQRPARSEGAWIDILGNETILLVEDEEIVRNLVREILLSNGYRVLEAASGDEAISICRSYPEPIDLLFTDVIMPKMSGPHLWAEMVKLRPELRVLFMSGYTDDSVIQNGFLDAGTPLLEKPFTADTLTRKLRSVLSK